MFGTPAKLQKIIDAYFAKCKKGIKRDIYDRKKQELRNINEEIPLTITGLALALKTNRQTLLNYQEKDEYFDTITRAKLMVENYAELCIFYGIGHPGGIQLVLKNHGWKDKTEVEQTFPTPLIINSPGPRPKKDNKESN